MDANIAADEVQPAGPGDDGEDDEGGMVTGKSTTDVTGPRSVARGGKKFRRKDRQHGQQRQGEADDDDSSDLSDESDDDGDSAQRLVARYSCQYHRNM